MRRARSIADTSAGRRRAANMARITVTTISSTSVNARRLAIQSVAPCNHYKGKEKPTNASLTHPIHDERTHLRRCASPISSRMNASFCTVEMTTFLPLLRKRRRSPLLSARLTVTDA
jgi:hypothetical protein